MVNSTCFGQSMATDAYGMPLHIANAFAVETEMVHVNDSGINTIVPKPFSWMVDVPANAHRWTLYPYLFDVHAYLCYLITVMMLVVLVTLKLPIKWRTKMNCFIEKVQHTQPVNSEVP